MNPPELRLDIVICSHNEAPYIPGALESLCLQTAPPGSFRIIFVDNASSDNTREIVESFQRRLPIEYVHEIRLGLNHARNAGLQRAKTEYVAFTDADAKMHPDWVSSILRVVDQEAPHLLGGPYFPFYIEPKPEWFKDAYNQVNPGRETRLLNRNEFLNGINMIWNLNTIRSLGGYDPDVGLTGRKLERGDETSLMLLAREKISDFKELYSPEIIVYHLTRPETYSIVYWVRRVFTEGINRHKIWQEEAPPGVIRQFKRTVWSFGTIAKGLAKVPLRNRSKFPYWQNYVYETLLPLIYNGGVQYHQFLRCVKKGR